MKDYVLRTLLILMVVCLAGNVFALPSALHYYKLDEPSGTTSTDSVGISNGLLSAYVVPNYTGKLNKAYYNNAGAGSANTQYKDSDFDFLTGNNATFAINFWAKYGSQYATFGAYTRLFEKASTDGASGIFLIADDGGGTGSTGYQLAFQTTPTDRKIWYEASTGTDNSAWHMWTISCANNDCNVFIDGTKRTPSTNHLGSYVGSTNDNNFFLGCMKDGTHDTNGFFDDFVVIQNTLSQADVTYLYNSGAGREYNATGIDVNFSYVLNGSTKQIELTDSSSIQNLTKTAWTWTSNGTTISTAQNYNYTATDWTDYNICLRVDTNDPLYFGTTCRIVSVSDLTSPTTSFSSYQVANTTDQNILLTCTDSNMGCNTINYKVDSGSWTQVKMSDYNTSQYDTNTNTLSNSGNTFVSFLELDLNKNNNLARYADNANLWVKEVGTSSSAYVQIQFIYDDGTNANVTDGPRDGTSFVNVSLANPNPTKSINKIRGYVRSVSAGNEKQIKDLNINYTKINILKSKTIYFTNSGTGLKTIQYYSTDNSDNTETTNTNYFQTFGKIKFSIFNESTLAPLTGVTINDGTTDYNTNATNYYDFNLQGISARSRTYTISKTGYETRYYQVDENEYSDLNVSFLLAPTSLVKQISFKFFRADKTTVITNTYMETKVWNKNNFTSGRIKTDESGYATFFINPSDGNTHFQFTWDGVSYDYNSVSLTINKPISETTGATISGNWTYQVTGLGLTGDNNVSTTTKTLALYTNTLESYDITIGDVAGTYATRTYQMRDTGNTFTENPLTPILPLATMSSQVTIQVKDYSNQPVAGIQLKFYKAIIGQSAKTLVLSMTTGNGGTVTANVIAKAGYDKYIMEAYLDGTQLKIFGQTEVTQYITESPTIIILDSTVAELVDPTHFYNQTITQFYEDTNGLIRFMGNVYGRTIMVSLYENGLLTATQVFNSQNGEIIWTMDENGTNYRIQINVDGTTKEIIDYNYLNYTPPIGIAENKPSYFNISGLSGNAKNILWIALFLGIIIFSSIIGHYTDKGMEAFFIMCIITSLIFTHTLNIQHSIIILCGVLWLGSRLINAWFDGGR